jgi:hypothetical protein
MPSTSKRTVCRLLMISSALCFALAGFELVLKREPFHTWFYSFAWWSYIIFVQSFLCSRGGYSLLFTNPPRFLMLLPLSVTIWLVFETFNFRLQNWHYLYLPPQTELRWLGYTIAFATVLPALFTTRDLLDYLGVFRDLRKAPLRYCRPSARFVWIGMAMLGLPILFPTVFFPLVWLGFVFLLEPFNYKYGTESILGDLAQGSFRNLYLLLLSGLLCGVLWECWNFWAGSKWFYTIPYLGVLKIFEMPILGFLGFPPFAVECYVMVNAFFLVLRQVQSNPNPRARIVARALLALLGVSFAITIFLGIDTFTVVSFEAGK